MGATHPHINARATGTVAGWQAKPDKGSTATLGARMLAGEWVGALDAVALGSSPTVATQVRATLTAAGYDMESRRTPGANGHAKQWRVKGKFAKAQGKRRAVSAEHAGTTHPALGAVLTVRALALDERGELVVQLANGNGAAWTAQITGHVAP